MTKEHIEELAFLGGRPEFDDFLHVGRPNIGDRANFMDRVGDMFDRHWLTNNGPLVQEFETRIAEFLNVKHCVAVCNATIALEIVARALDLRGEVIIPSFTFVATAHALHWQRITPVFCDVDPHTHNIDPVEAEKLITPRTTGIVGVHVWGRACDVNSLEFIARKHNLKLMFDAAHAFACSHQGQMIGGFGDAEVFSFHATKFFNSFEGGAVTTNDNLLARKMREMRNFGFSGLDGVIEVGTNGKMSEISAAMGLTSLESLDDFIAVNKRNYYAYKKGLLGIPGIKLVEYDGHEKNNFQYVVVEVDESQSGINRDLLVRVLHAENILARRYFYPGCHQMEPYRTLYPEAGERLLETEKLTDMVIQLPTGTAITEEIVFRICELIKFIVVNSLKLKTMLPK